MSTWGTIDITEEAVAAATIQDIKDAQRHQGMVAHVTSVTNKGTLHGNAHML